MFFVITDGVVQREAIDIGRVVDDTDPVGIPADHSGKFGGAAFVALHERPGHMHEGVIFREDISLFRNAPVIDPVTVNLLEDQFRAGQERTADDG